jgi:hypothetical protein
VTKIWAIHAPSPKRSGVAGRIARAARMFPPCARANKVNRLYLRIAIIALAVIDLVGCATTSHHQFTDPAKNWRTRSGQLMYRNAKTTLIGEAVVRFSENGDFELTFSKGPGVNLLVVRQDASFVEIKGALARKGWSGPVDHAPPQLRGWLGLRDKLIQTKDRQSIRHSAGTETFLFRF